MAVELVRFILPVLVGQAAKAVEKATSRFTATVGHGKSQRHILLVGGRKIDSCLFYGNGQLFYNVNIVHEIIYDLWTSLLHRMPGSRLSTYQRWRYRLSARASTPDSPRRCALHCQTTVQAYP